MANMYVVVITGSIIGPGGRDSDNIVLSLVSNQSNTLNTVSSHQEH